MDRLTSYLQVGPWLCVPGFRQVCLCRLRRVKPPSGRGANPTPEKARIPHFSRCLAPPRPDGLRNSSCPTKRTDSHLKIERFKSASPFRRPGLLGPLAACQRRRGGDPLALRPSLAAGLPLSGADGDSQKLPDEFFRGEGEWRTVRSMGIRKKSLLMPNQDDQAGNTR
jgi:hypothetical protein